MLTEAERRDTFLEIHSGTDGAESCDWAAMLARMYFRWAERHGFDLVQRSQVAGDKAGIRSVSYLIKGSEANDWLRTEIGVHRLVRVSPFDSLGRRHTSFASVLVGSSATDMHGRETRLAQYVENESELGHDIRSYMLGPFQKVMDFRTGFETADAKGVLDGDLDAFMSATLAQGVSGMKRGEAQADD